MFDSILNNIPRNEREDDYTERGLLFCGVCRTPKEAVVDGVLRPIMCAHIEQEEKDRRVERRARERQEKIRENTARGITDKIYLDWTFENDDKANPEASTTARRYVEEWMNNKRHNKGLLFCGDVGTGKTFLACAIANELLSRGVSVVVTDLPKLVKRAQDFNDDITEDIERCSLLVLDDVGVERSTEFSIEQCYNIINTRYKTGKPLIVTTNLTPKEMAEQKNVASRRMYDRILEMCCTTVIVDGRSRRLEIRKNKQKQ